MKVVSHFAVGAATALMFPVALFASPAQSVGSINAFSDDIFSNIVSPLLGLGSMAMFVYFIFGVARYFYTKDSSEEALSTLKRHLTWGLVGIVIVFSIGGIIGFLTSFSGAFK